jgi:hypothetical protein
VRIIKLVVLVIVIEYFQIAYVLLETLSIAIKIVRIVTRIVPLALLKLLVIVAKLIEEDKIASIYKYIYLFLFNKI